MNGYFCENCGNEESTTEAKFIELDFEGNEIINNLCVCASCSRKADIN